MEESGGSLAYGDGSAWDLTRIKGSPASIEDIRSLLTLVDIDCGAGAESCGVRKILLTHDQRLLQIFGRGLCWFGIFGLGSMSVEDVYAPIKFLGRDMPCDYV